MGRYYNGDIEGKFWFGVQSSDDGEFFGAVASEPNEIDYYVSDIEQVEEGITKCKKQIGEEYLLLLDNFFNNCSSYNDEQIAKKLCVTIEKVNFLKETKPVYCIETLTGKTVVVRTDVDLANKIK